MTVASKETLEKFMENEEIKSSLFDALIFGKTFMEFSLNGVNTLRLEDVMVSMYNEVLKEYENLPLEVKHSTQLEF